MVGKISKQTPPQRRYTNGKTHGKNIHLYLQKKKKPLKLIGIIKIKFLKMTILMACDDVHKLSLLMRMKNDTAILEQSLKIYKAKHNLIIRSSNHTPTYLPDLKLCIHPKKHRLYKYKCKQL